MTTIPENIIEKTHKFAASIYHNLPIVVEWADGVWVYDYDGRYYLDMMANWSALVFGHRHPRLVKALVDQLQRTGVMPAMFYTAERAGLCEKLADLTSLDKAIILNSGVEAFEAAVKIARRWGYEIRHLPNNRAKIVVCKNAFHGRSVTAVSAASDEKYRKGFSPFTPGFLKIPFGKIEPVEEAIICYDAAAFILEPVQGEAGVIIPPAGYLKRVREICTETRTLLILDEVQTGMGRTGKNFAYEHEEIRPDVVLLGKGLGGGLLPVSAVVGKSVVMSLLDPGSHGSTFGGNPLACAVASEAIDVLNDQQLAGNSSKMGTYFLEELRKIEHPLIEEVRGIGLFIAIELNKNKARAVCDLLFKKQVLCLPRKEHIISFAPPLIINKDQIDWGLKRIRSVFEGIV
ncbi:MAG: ornithine--oxo-acid transaminase [bacterium]|nr:ornithine--oxo-acid transaminase [bacterium]